MTNEQLRKYFDIQFSRLEFQLNIVTDFLLCRYGEQYPSLLADLQRRLNDTRIADFDRFLAESKKDRKKLSRAEAYEKFFEK